MSAMTSNDHGDNLKTETECMHLDATLFSPPATQRLGLGSGRRKQNQILGVALSECATKLWAATASMNASSVALSGYSRSSHGKWELRYSFAGLGNLPTEAVKYPFVLLPLPATHSLAAITPNGLVTVTNTDNPSASPRRFPLSGYKEHKSLVVAKALPAGSGLNSHATDLLTHVRLHVGRKLLMLERFVFSLGPKPVSVKLRVEVVLSHVWASCGAQNAQGAPVRPKQLLDCCWASGGDSVAASRSAQEVSTQHDDAMLVALDTCVLRVYAPPGRRVQEDAMGNRWERWLVRVLDLPVILNPSHLAGGVSTGGAAHDADDDALSGSVDSSACGSPRPFATPPGHAAASSVSASAEHAESSVLSRYLGSTPLVPPGRSSLSGHWGAASSISSRLPDLSSSGLSQGGEAGAQRCIRILPLLVGHRGSADGPSGGAGRLPARFLVVTPPFVVVVDGVGEPDGLHAVLDIPSSLDRESQRRIGVGRHTALVQDAAVVADKLLISIPSWILVYEWSTTQTDAVADGASSHLPQHLELAQLLLTPSATFSDGLDRMRLHGSPHGMHAVACGPRRAHVYAPQPASLHARRLVQKGDVFKALRVISDSMQGSGAATKDPAEPLQVVIALAVAECLKQDQWACALDFLALADSRMLNACQLLYALVPGFLNTRRPPLQHVSKEMLEHFTSSMRAALPLLCPRQPKEVVAAFEALLAAPPSKKLLQLADTCVQGQELTPWRFGSEEVQAMQAASLDVKGMREVCSTLASCLGDMIKRAVQQPACDGERFPRILYHLSKAGELYPDLEPGIRGANGHVRCPQAHPFPSRLPLFDAAVATGTDGQALVHFHWCKALQLWLLLLSGQHAQMELECSEAGMWPFRPGRGERSPAQHQRQLVDCLVQHMQDSGAGGCAGLLLRTQGRMAAALDLWLSEFDRSCTYTAPLLEAGEPGGMTWSVPAVSECITVEQHVVSATLAQQAASNGSGPQSGSGHGPSSSGVGGCSVRRARAAARALVSSARAAEVMCDERALPTLTDNHLAWLLRMPCQCALAVLLARPSLAGDGLFSTFHSVGADGRDAFLDWDEGDVPEAAAASQPTDCMDAASVWLQVRFLRARLHSRELKRQGSRQATDGETAVLQWRSLLQQLIWMILKLSAPACDVACAGGEGVVHAVYGSQAGAAEALLDSCVPHVTAAALRSTVVRASLAAAVAPLRPVTVGPSRSAHVPSSETDTAGVLEQLSVPPRLLARAAPGASQQHPLFKLFLDVLPSTPPELVCELLAGVREQTRLGGSPVARQLLCALSEAHPTPERLHALLDDLLPVCVQPTDGVAAVSPRNGKDPGLAGARADGQARGVGGAPQAATAEGGGGRRLSIEHLHLVVTLLQRLDDRRALQPDELSPLWSSVRQRCNDAGRVLVWHWQQQSGGGQQGEEDWLAQWRLRGEGAGDADPGSASAAVALRDAECLSCWLRLVEDAADVSHIQRALHTKCMHDAARATIVIEDCYVKWFEGPTSMDPSVEPERTVVHFHGEAESQQFLHPKGQGGRPWCAVCKQSLSHYSPSAGRFISCRAPGFICQDPRCLDTVSGSQGSAWTHATSLAPSPMAAKARPNSPRAAGVAAAGPAVAAAAEDARGGSCTLKLASTVTQHVHIGAASPEGGGALTHAVVGCTVHLGEVWLVYANGSVLVHGTWAAQGGRRHAVLPVPDNSRLEQACVAVNSTDPSVAAIAVTFPLAESDGLASGPAVREVAVSETFVVCLADDDTLVGSVQRLHLGAGHGAQGGAAAGLDSAVAALSWDAAGESLLLATVRGTVCHVSTPGTAAAVRALATVPAGLGQPRAMAVVAGRSSALLVATSQHLLLLCGESTGEVVAQLEACATCSSLWSRAVMIDGRSAEPEGDSADGDGGSRASLLSVALSEGSRHGGAACSHVSWLAGSCIHMFDLDLGTQLQGPAHWQDVCLLHTYVRAVLCDGVHPQAIATQPTHTLVLSTASGLHAAPPGVAAFSRATGQEVAAVAVSAGTMSLSAPAWLLVDPADPFSEPDGLEGLYLIDQKAAVRLQVGVRQHAACMELIESGRFLEVLQVLEHPYLLTAGEEAEVREVVGMELVNAGLWQAAAQVMGKMRFGLAREVRDTRSSCSPLQFAQVALLFAEEHQAHEAPDAVSLWESPLCKFLLTHLREVTKRAAQDLTAALMALWMLLLLLQRLNIAQLCALQDEAWTATLERGSTLVLDFLREWHTRLQQADVVELLQRRGWQHLLRAAVQIYGDHAFAFDLTVLDDQPAAVDLLQPIQQQHPERLNHCIQTMMWRAPVLTCTQLQQGSGGAPIAVPADIVLAAAQCHMRPGSQCQRNEVAGAVVRFMSTELEGRGTPLGRHGHHMLIQMLVLCGDETPILRYMEQLTASAAKTGSELPFSLYWVLAIARQHGLRRVARTLLLHEGKVHEAVSHTDDLLTAVDVISRAPREDCSQLWLEAVHRGINQAHGSHSDVGAVVRDALEHSQGSLMLEDATDLLPRHSVDLKDWRGLLARSLTSSATAVAEVKQQFYALTARARERKQELDARVTQRGSLRMDARCPVCHAPLSDPPRRGTPAGRGIPHLVHYPGAAYHTGCAACAISQLAAPAEGEAVLNMLGRMADESEDAGMQRDSHRGRQALHQLTSLLQRGDPSLSPDILLGLDRVFGHSQQAMALEWDMPDVDAHGAPSAGAA